MTQLCTRTRRRDTSRAANGATPMDDLCHQASGEALVPFGDVSAAEQGDSCRSSNEACEPCSDGAGWVSSRHCSGDESSTSPRREYIVGAEEGPVDDAGAGGAGKVYDGHMGCMYAGRGWGWGWGWLGP